MKTLKIILSTFLFLLIANHSIFSQGWMKAGHRKMGMGPGSHMRGGALFGNLEMLKQKLNLNDKQFQKIAELNLEYKKSFLDLKEKLAPLGIKLRKLLLSNEVNLNAVKNILQKIANLKVEIRMNRIKQRLAIEKFLTKNQRLLLKSLKMHKRRGPGRGGFGGF